MTDRMTPQQRHYCMSRIRSKNTKPEMLVSRWLWSHGYRYRLHERGVPGCPDIVLRSYRTAIFVNGCFWHGHEGCPSYRLPKTNTSFWRSKITRNRQRDMRNYALLHANGWHVIVVWECQLSKNHLEDTMRSVEVAINDNLISIYRKPLLPEAHPAPQLAPDSSSLPAYQDNPYPLPFAAEDDE